MTQPFIRTALAAALFVAAPVFAADEAKPAPVAPPMPELLEAYTASMTEVQSLLTGKQNAVATLDKLATFKFSPETSAKLVKVFGNDHPLKVERTGNTKGKLDYAISLQPLKYTDANGNALEWTEMTVKLVLDQAGRNLDATGTWPSMVFSAKDVRMAATDMHFASKQKRGMGELWFGQAEFGIDKVQVDVKTTSSAVVMEDLRGKSSMTQHGKLMDIQYGFSIKSFKADTEQVDAINFATRVTNIDIKSVLAIKATMEKMQAAKQTPEQQKAAVMAMFKGVGKAILNKGAAIMIDDLSARYHGQTASLKGRVAFDGAKESDIDQPMNLINKLNARFEVRLPVAMVQDIAKTVARKQAEAAAAANPAQPVNEANVEQMGQTFTDMIVGKTVGQGYARMENGELRSTIEFKGGKLSFNGKRFEMPMMGMSPPAAAPAPAPQAQPEAQEAPKAQ